MSQLEPTASEPAKSEPEKPKETVGALFQSKIVEALAGALVVAVAGYLGALIISPDQLYRKFFGPDPDYYLGEWDGVVGGRPARLDIQEQVIIPRKKTYWIKGTLAYAGSSKKIVVEGKADSSFILSGSVDAGQLNIELDREETEPRTVKGQYVRMLPPEGAPGARICPPVDDITKMIPAEQCPVLPGRTMFFR